MKICISSGHSQSVRGAEGILDEVNEARKIVDRVAQLLGVMGVGVDVFHDNVSTTQSANLDWLVDHHNGKTRDLDVSVHLNCFDGTASGCEVLFVTQEELAQKVADAICAASGLTNRGAKHRDDLKWLNSTSAPAILLEVCFVDSRTDAHIMHAKFEAICHAISESISGKELSSCSHK